jgi:4-hydroxysphinganine ceramide fatty acyl 2-hydroxylase
MAKVLSCEEVSKHNSPQDAWVVVDGRVCDVTGFVHSHPGGLDVLEGRLGKDVSHLIRSPNLHLHSRSAYKILDQCCIGVLQGTEGAETQAFEWSEKYKKWKEEDIIDWSQPVLSQVAKLGERYKYWVHAPVHCQLRLFHSDLMELCSVCPWWLVPLLWIPFSVFMMWLATTHTTCVLPWTPDPQPLSWTRVISLLPFGFLIWTLVEYILHRFIFHMEPWYSSGFSLQFHFIMHGQHHKVPFDHRRLVFPPLPASIVMLLIYMPFAQLQVVPLAEQRALFAGGVVGYVTYEMVHYYLHHGSPPPGSYLASLKSYHVAHHYVNPNRGYGVSSKLWDLPFGTKI